MSIIGAVRPAGVIEDDHTSGDMQVYNRVASSCVRA